MSKIVWDAEGQKTYETGVDHGVLYVKSSSGYGTGVAWNGLTAVTENPSGAEPTALWADNIKYLNLMSAEEFGATIEAYTYPEEFKECDGSAEVAPGVYIGQQDRKLFGFTYRTLLGNDTDGQAHGYKIHIVYNCQASPSEKGYETVNDSPDAITFSWEVATTPATVTNTKDTHYKPTATIEIDSTKTTTAKMEALEDLLYGTENAEPTLPSVDQIIALMKAA